jgi:hypothetical protein
MTAAPAQGSGARGFRVIDVEAAVQRGQMAGLVELPAMAYSNMLSTEFGNNALVSLNFGTLPSQF